MTTRPSTILVLLGFVTLFFLSCNSSTAQESSSSQTEVLMSDFVKRVAEDFRQGLPATLCTKGEFILACFDVPAQTCLEEMQVNVDKCASDVEKRFAQLDSTFTCANRQDCSDKGATIGKKIGQEIGSCAGNRFELAHPNEIKKSSCLTFLKNKGLDTKAIEDKYSTQ